MGIGRLLRKRYATIYQSRRAYTLVEAYWLAARRFSVDEDEAETIYYAILRRSPGYQAPLFTSETGRFGGRVFTQCIREIDERTGLARWARELRASQRSTWTPS